MLLQIKIDFALSALATDLIIGLLAFAGVIFAFYQIDKNSDFDKLQRDFDKLDEQPPAKPTKKQPESNAPKNPNNVTN